jgi:hypothetical protein
MAYIGTNPTNIGIGLFSQDTFTGDGSTVAFDLTNTAPDGGGNELQVFVDNVRQQEGSSNAYTLGYDGSSVFKRITFTAAPAASASIYVLNPGTKNVQQVSALSDNTVTAAKVQANAITTAKILDNNVTTAKILDSNITVAKMAANSINSDQYVDGSIDLIHLSADSVNADKITDDAISEEHLDVTSITGHAELSASRADGDFILIYDSSAGTLKKIQASNLGIVNPTITSVSPTNVLTGDGTGNHTIVINGTNFASAATAKLINDSGTDIAFDTLTRNSDIKLTGVIAKSSLPNSGEPFDVSVTSNALTTTLTNQINVDASPAYVTAAGTLGTLLNGNRGNTLEVIASDPESAGTVSYEIQSGSLPAGASGATLHENGVSKFKISGFSAVGSNTTSNFVLRAVDAASNTTSRAFAITVNAPVSTSFNASGTFSVPSGVAAVDVLVVGGGAGGGGPGGSNRAGGGGAGGLVFMPAFPVSPGSSVPITVGDKGTVATNGQNSVFGAGEVWALTAKGGGGGGEQGDPGVSGGSGGGGGGCGGSGAAGNQTTQPANSGAYGFGTAGGSTAPQMGADAGGGGGGAGSAGAPGQFVGGQPSVGGNGGSGKAYTIADGTTSVFYSGGGNANGANGSNNNPVAQSGGGGQGNGCANKGGGGAYQQEGGKGIVIVRY